MAKIALTVLLTFTLVIAPYICLAETITIDTDTASYDEIVDAITVLKQVRVQMLTDEFTRKHTPAPATSIMFRQIPWYTTRQEVLSLIGNPKTHSTHAQNTAGQVYTNGIGFENSYSSLNVAGYEASCDVYYVYPVVDNVLIRNSDYALLYMAEYRFTGLGNTSAAIEDITTKLVHLYGDYQRDNRGRLVWIDDSNNHIILYSWNSNFTLWYYAGNTEELLHAADSVVDAENAEAEELLRIENINNTNGL